MEKEAAKLVAEIKDSIARLRLQPLRARVEEIERASHSPDFWNDRSKAATQMQELKRLKQKIDPWFEIEHAAQELQELASLNDPKLQLEISSGLEDIRRRHAQLSRQLSFNDPYDDHGAIISLSAGAGGTDAQDWTQMLFRMYVRFFERNHWHYRVIDESPGEEAGLKNVVLQVEGDDYVYGKLRGEHGIHRLVRLSPFNADHLRQTSFAKVEVVPKIDSPSEVAIDNKDLKIDVFRSGGHGGQSVNTTDSAVRITHLPSGISVTIQNERSQMQNRETALTLLRSKLAQLQLEQHSQALNEIKGPNQSAEWGNQIRSYVMHPYKQVKDLRSQYETSDIDAVMDGKIEPLIDAYLNQKSAF